MPTTAKHLENFTQVVTDILGRQVMFISTAI